MAHPHSSGTIIVTGDVTLDWNLVRTQRSALRPTAWTAEEQICAYWQRGGAALMADLIEAVADDLHQRGLAHAVVRQSAAPTEPSWPGDPRFHHSYALWSSCSYKRQPSPHLEAPAWRVAEFLGVGRCTQQAASGAADWQLVVDDTAAADLVILDDAALGFREQAARWPQAITTKGSRPWVLLKMAQPVAEGPLWEHLHRHHAERLVVLMTVDDLRRTEVQISQALSWERTAQDVAWELVHNPRVNALTACAHVVVSFYAAGAMLLSRAVAEDPATGARIAPRCQLFFDPRVIEGMWEQEHPGGMIGYTSCLAAGLARQVMIAPEQPDLAPGMQRGLAAMRTLHREGYGVRGAPAPQAQLAFPTARIAADLAQNGAPFAVAAVPTPRRGLLPPTEPSPTAPTGGWTILHDRYPDTLQAVAQRIVLAGVEVALPDVPRGQFGKLVTVDRQEIEGFRSLRTLVSEYCRHTGQKRPLSIAVFGAPGSGKSFGITQVAESLLPGQIKVLEFNLSQFSGPESLLEALHQVRDVGLSGQIPLVFWDEFDTALADVPLGWLRYFLAPMQDGRFQEAQILHPLGRCIFVFAGGTSTRMETFGDGLEPAQFRAAKGTDFVSRLQGYVNILGPNPQVLAGTTAQSDPYALIRRAILLRSMLLRHAPQLVADQDGRQELQIDPGVLRAFLATRTYRHGVRSMEAILAMSVLGGTSRFERSCLPAEAQLALHVDGQDFLALVQQPTLEGALLERLAEAAHTVFCTSLRAQGYDQEPQTGTARKTHRALTPYAELPAEDQEQNRALVRDLPHKLAQVGYVIMPARGQEPPAASAASDLERLAELEHERWLRAKLQAGWRWGSITDRARKQHPDLLPWQPLSPEEKIRRYSPAEAAALGEGELPEAEKDKDRALMRGIPQILAEAGYTMVKLREASTEASGTEEARP